MGNATDVWQGTLALMILKTLTRAGRKRLAQETKEWDRATAILARFIAPEQPQ